METLEIELTNCYGIAALRHVFDFRSQNAQMAYAVYAQNGLMKTSFTKTFEDLSNGKQPKEERYNRPSTCVAKSDGNPISKESIFVLKAEIDIQSECSAVTNILVNPEHKARYDTLLVDLDKLKQNLISSLQRLSKIKKADVEKLILKDTNKTEFPTCIQGLVEASVPEDLMHFEYSTIFDSKTLEIIQSDEFKTKAKEFNERYQELFEQAGTIYKKGVFNPAKADTSFSVLDKHGFFAGGHRVHLEGDSSSISKEELNERLEKIHATIDGDEALKKLRKSLAANAQTQALTELFEKLSATEIDLLLEQLRPENQAKFKRDLWAFYVHQTQDATVYLESYSEKKAEIDAIEAAAAQDVPRWIDAVELFNDRFIDMPFTLSVDDQIEVTLGKKNAQLRFDFNDGTDSVSWSRSEIKTLSQGEKRAVYLLNLIFEVEDRKMNSKETLFVIDDAADSFDYKNKHAILQYLQDLCKTPHFHQIILTHNYDFFRALANGFVHRNRCLMANKQGSTGEITLTKACGVKNYFIGMWKEHVATDQIILCATIPFTRNLIEYTKGENDEDYIKLTSLLHWKSDTEQITIGNYFEIYNRLFGKSHSTSDTRKVSDLVFQKSNDICAMQTLDGLNLENKVLLSISIRLEAEKFMMITLRKIKGDPAYWCPASSNQFGNLINEYLMNNPAPEVVRILEKVSVTVSSNIHLNSFMYEPILDLSVDHLISLYSEVKSLSALAQN
jgi:hypothetical protein